MPSAAVMRSHIRFRPLPAHRVGVRNDTRDRRGGEAIRDGS
jgi:hypothetical protein